MGKYRLKTLNDSKAFIEYSNHIDDICKDIEEHNPHYFVMKIPNKKKLQQTVYNHSSDTDFKDFMNLYKKCTAKPYSVLVIDTTLPL